MLPVSKSPSVEVCMETRVKCFMPFGMSVFRNQASVSVRKLFTIGSPKTVFMSRRAFASLSEVPDRSVELRMRWATNFRLVGMTSLVGLQAIRSPRSSVHWEIAISAFSRAVSLRSDAVVGGVRGQEKRQAIS